MIIKSSKIVTKEERENKKIELSRKQELNNIEKEINIAKEDSKQAAMDTIAQLQTISEEFKASGLNTAEYFDKSNNRLQLFMNNVLDAIKTLPVPINEVSIDNNAIIDEINSFKALFDESTKVKNATIDPKELNKKLIDIIDLLTKIKDKKSPMFVGGGGGGSVDTSKLATETTATLIYNIASEINDKIKTNQTERYDYSSSTSIYTGSADIGTANASTGWTIVLYDLASSSAASGKVATDVSWNNRATGTYA